MDESTDRDEEQVGWNRQVVGYRAGLSQRAETAFRPTGKDEEVVNGRIQPMI